jgi:hypothetical protein
VSWLLLGVLLARAGLTHRLWSHALEHTGYAAHSRDCSPKKKWLKPGLPATVTRDHQ